MLRLKSRRYEISRAFVLNGARVIMVNRKEEQGQSAIDKIKEEAGADAKIEWIPCDMGDLNEIKEVFSGMRERESRLDLVRALSATKKKRKEDMIYVVPNADGKTAHTLRGHQCQPVRRDCRRAGPTLRGKFPRPILRRQPALASAAQNGQDAGDAAAAGCLRVVRAAPQCAQGGAFWVGGRDQQPRDWDDGGLRPDEAGDYPRSQVWAVGEGDQAE